MSELTTPRPASAEELAQYAWQHLELLNQRLTKEGKTIDSVEENLAELTRQANAGSL